ncbi:MAG: TonB-dependent receptor [Pseudomonadota bacterium]
MFNYRVINRVLITLMIACVGLPVKAEIEEVVVTARKTEESISESPVAVSALTGEFFDSGPINTIEELVRFVPGLELTPLNTSRATGPKMRGISTFSFSDGFESSVATVLDGVVMGREAQGFFDLYGIESVEVLKGPQGTLFGKNASAGVINVRTLAPEFETGGGVDLMYGSFDEVLARGTITGPITEDTLAYRLSGSVNQHDGKIENVLPGQDDINDKDTWSLRGKLLFTPTDNVSATLIADYVEEDNRCCLPTYRVIGPPSPAILFALNSPVLQLSDALAALGIDGGEDNREVAVFDSRILQESEAWGTSLQIDVGTSWGDLTSITAWREWEIDEFNEADGLSTSDLNNRNGTRSDSTQFSQEIRLSGQINENIDFVTGLFYFNQDLDAFGRVDIEFAIPFPPFFNVSTAVDRTVETESTAIFGEFTFHLTDAFSLIVGGRYTREDVEADFSRIASPILAGFPFQSNFGPDLVGSQQVDDNDFSGRVIARYFWNEDIMTYLTWSRGYKGPGIDVAESANAGFLAEPGGLPVLDPEIPTLYELGAKFRLAEDRLVLNTAVFHQTVEDLQAIATDQFGVGRNLSIDEILSTGVEIDLTWTPGIEGLTLTASLSYLDTYIEDFTDRPDLEDQRFRDVPRWNYSFTSDYFFGVNDAWNGFFRAEVVGQSSKNTNLDDDPTADVDGYSLVNFRLGLISADDRYRITLMAQNVFDEDYPNFVFGSSYAALDGTTRAQFLGDPATYAIQFGINF